MVIRTMTQVVPTRPAVDGLRKAKVEACVLIVERWLIGRLRHRAVLQSRRAERGNRRTAPTAQRGAPIRRLGRTRRALLEELDRPALKPLADRALRVRRMAAARSASIITSRSSRITTGAHVRPRESRGAAHRAHRRDLPQRQADRRASARERQAPAHDDGRAHAVEPSPLRRMDRRAHSREAAKIGPATCRAVASSSSSEQPHPEQGFRSCLGILRLGGATAAKRVEAAAHARIDIGARPTARVKSILEHELDRRPRTNACSGRRRRSRHSNIRGPRYYH